MKKRQKPLPGTRMAIMKSTFNGHGSSYANGPQGPKMTWEQREVAVMNETIWKHL
jgi:hypothetical protein